MNTKTLFSGLRSGLSRFHDDRGGNVAIMFALALIPIVGAVGAAVDYSHGNSVKVAMQAAVDATALKLSKEAASLKQDDLNKKADAYFKATFNRKETTGIAVTPTYSAKDKTLTVVGTGAVKTDFMRLVGLKQLKIKASSTVAWGGMKLEVALVLDNTGSMATSGKMDALRAATDNFLNIMQKAAPAPGDVRIGIVPFDFQVNVGKGNSGMPWIDWGLLSKNAASTTGWSGSGYSGTSYRDNDDDTRDDDANDTVDVANWNGCVVDRDQPNDVLDTKPTKDIKTMYPAVNCNLAEMQPLTSDFALLKTKAAAMKAVGKTNLTIGLVWGWHMLTNTEPMTGASAAGKNIGKYLIFMTDGLNTQNRWTTSAKSIDDRTKLVCENIKKSGIQVYTIRVLEGNAKLLKDCASHSSQYFDVTQASQLTEVFTKIAGELSRLRISK